jgi:hypothetical protein
VQEVCRKEDAERDLLAEGHCLEVRRSGQSAGSDIFPMGFGAEIERDVRLANDLAGKGPELGLAY